MGNSYSFDNDTASSGSSIIIETNGKYSSDDSKVTVVKPTAPNGYLSNNVVEPSELTETKLDLQDNETEIATSSNSSSSSISCSSVKNSDDLSKEKKKKKPAMVGVLEVFRFADTKDRLLMMIGTMAAIVQGAAMPIMFIVFGNMSNLFIQNGQWNNIANLLAQNISSMCSPFCSSSAGGINATINSSATVMPTCSSDTTATLPIVSTTTAMSVFPTASSVCSWCVNITGPEITNNINQVIDWLTIHGCYQQVNEINQYTGSMTTSFMSEMSQYALYFTYIGIVVLVVSYFQMTCWYTTAYNQSERIRSELLRSILRQEISWFDTQEVGELNTRIVDDVDQIENGIGDKLALLFQYFSTFIAGFVVGFVYGWELTLVILSISPLLAVAGGVMGQLLATMTKKELAAYAKAGAVAEEVISAIRTVTAFGGQEKEANRYSVNLAEARRVGLRKGLVNGFGMGSVFFVLFGSYALAFWFGSTLVLGGSYTAGSMMIVFFSVLTGAFSIGAATPNLQDFANARGAAYTVYRIIDQKPSIDSGSNTGLKPEKLVGNIEFRDVVFRYPSRPDVQVMTGLSLKVNVGQTVALVGSSGCGKSTCVQLLQRFYDLLAGQVLIDGIDVKDYNIKWLRQHIGVVSQEPILFGTTIAENIRYGREDATQEDIERAAREANAHNFIYQLPMRYETLVGERGAQLSGGQKQRIAIARALVRDPTILLLDEATSALDTESEGIVQEALDKAREGRTTIVIAHRLSTVQTADIIAGIVNGTVVEKGTHADLMKEAGVYYTLFTNQKQIRDEDNEDEGSKEKLRSMSFKRERSQTGEIERTRSLSIISQRGTPLLNEQEVKLPSPSIKRIMHLNSPEWPQIVIGCTAALIMGCIQPFFAILFADILGVFSQVDTTNQQQQCDFYAGMFAVIGAAAFLASFIMQWMFAQSGEQLTTRLRETTFKSLLKMEIAYFDDHLNSTGALCSRLSTDAAAVKGATGSRLASVIQSFGSIGFGLIIGFINSWELTLFVLAFAPFMLITGFVRVKIMLGTRGERNKKMEEAAKFAIEAIENIRTVATLTQEDMFHSKFCASVAVPYNTNRRKAHYIGVAFAFSQAMIYFADAATFYFGAWLVAYNGLNYESMFKVLTAILFGAMAAGQASSFAPDYGKAKMAAARLFALFDRVPPIDSSSEAGEKLSEIAGSVELRDVHFNYPTRPDVPVLKGLSIVIKPGQVVALVGSSGCGKSTVVQLIERFYEPLSGQVLLDGCPVESLHLQWLRRQVGIVSQEPVLFDCSIRENIAYGDNFRDIGMDEIMEAARKANIHNFIQSLPQAYDTNVGDKGAQLSGGQKQRVAIARALLRSPKILLLDEATSALDTESEKVVQEALERAQEGRTSIVIAHRLSTIQNADCIIVLDSGRIAEIGTHNELTAKRGIYYRLNTRQAIAGH